MIYFINSVHFFLKFNAERESFFKLILDNKLLAALAGCEPEPLLANPDPNAPDSELKTLTTLSDLVDKELVFTIGWAKQIPGRTNFKTSCNGFY